MTGKALATVFACAYTLGAVAGLLYFVLFTRPRSYWKTGEILFLVLVWPWTLLSLGIESWFDRRAERRRVTRGKGG